MVKVLFITEKNHSEVFGNERDVTNNHWNLFKSFDNTGLGERQNFFINPTPGDIWSREEVDNVLLTNQYDCAVISVYHHLPSTDIKLPKGSKMVMLWWDGVVSKDGIKHRSSFCPQINFDHDMDYPNVYSMHVPQDETQFYRDDNVVKDIDISFIGSVDSHRPDRAALRDKLINAGFNIFFGGGRGPSAEYQNLSIEEYTSYFRRSKITLNIQGAHGTHSQRKGRNFECSATGSFMVANYPEMLNGWFEDGKHYVSYDENNIIEKLKHYLDHEEERKQIANNLYQLHQEKYTAKHFWQKIFDICEVKY